MKVIAINSSPNMGEGNTALILAPFLAGMKEAGAEVEVFYTQQLEINPCRGEGNCWFMTPGKCFQKDDMAWLISRLAGADVWVFATPVYVDGMPGPLKNLIDRIVPLIQPFFEMRDGHCRHPRQDGTKSGKIILVANCGYWEMDNFDPLLAHVKAIAKNVDREFAGALLRPHGAGLRPMIEAGASVGDIFEAAKKAGHQLATEGRMAPETLKTVSRELLPLDQYVQGTNQWFEQLLGATQEG